MSSTATSFAGRVGEATISIATQVGGTAIMAGQIVRRFFPPRIDRYEMIRNMYRMGVKSVPIVSATAMFNGRVGANNTAELGTMVVTEQIDALRALAIDPITYLVVPRVISIITIMTALCVVGDFLSILGAMGMAWGLLDIYPMSFYTSALPMLDPWDFYVGIIKAFLFGIMISLNSCYFGLSTKGGAAGVGAAVNDSVVAAASGIFIADYLSTFVLG